MEKKDRKEQKHEENKECIETIKNTLEKKRINYDCISEKERSYLVEIEQWITNMFILEKNTYKVLAKAGISIKGASDNTSIARQTFYNVPLLQEYVQYRADDYEKISILSKIEHCNEEIKRLKAENSALHKRDVEIEELKREIKKMTEKIKQQKKEIKIMSSSEKIVKFREKK